MNLSNEVKALHLVQLEYENTIEQILPYFYEQLNKNQQIRVRQWIKKLSSVINNILWRKNRNLYAKLLLAMLKTKSGLIQPFNKCPPDGSLPKLSIYQIPYNLKQFIENYERQYKLKQQIKSKSKSKQKFSRTEVNKENIIGLSNMQKSRKKLQKSLSKQKLNKTTAQKVEMSNTCLTSKKSSLSTNKIQKKQQKIKISEVNQLLTQTLQYLQENFELLLKNHKGKNSEAKQISKLRSLILKINDFQNKAEKQNHLEQTNNIIQRLFN